MRPTLIRTRRATLCTTAWAVLVFTAATAGQAPSPRDPVSSEGRPLPHVESTIATVANFYILPLGDVLGPRVSLVQTADIVVAVWLTSQGEVYGRGAYRWNGPTRSFVGTSSTRVTCEIENSGALLTFDVGVREELDVLSDGALRDRWAKPLDVDCSTRLVEKFKWVERQWVPADQDWKPLPHRDVPPVK